MDHATHAGLKQILSCAGMPGRGGPGKGFLSDSRLSVSRGLALLRERLVIFAFQPVCLSNNFRNMCVGFASRFLEFCQEKNINHKIT